MAKQRRMGRNLDALLSGASKQRSASEAAEQVNDSELDKPAVENSDKEQNAYPQSSPVSQSDENQTIPNEPDNQLSESTEVHSVTNKNTLVPGKPVSASPGVTESNETLHTIAIEQIRRGSYQPRRLFDQELLQELADSIKAQGMIQPIIVRPFAGAYELVAGERRWRAAQIAGLTSVPAIIREMADKSVAAVSLIENIQRKNLNPLEEAAALERLCDEFGMTHKAVAESVGKSRAAVSNLLRLLELHDEVKVMVDKGDLEMGHARALLGAPKDQQHRLALQAVERNLTVRAVEKLIRQLQHQEQHELDITQSTNEVDPDIARLSQKLGETLGAKVRIQHKENGAGKLEINYTSVAELQGILAHIK